MFRAMFRSNIGVKIDDVSSTACTSNVTAELILTRLAPTNPGEGNECFFGTNLGSFFRTKTWSTCGAGVGDFFSSSWFGAVGNNPIMVSHQDTGTPTPGDNFFTHAPSNTRAPRRRRQPVTSAALMPRAWRW